MASVNKNKLHQKSWPCSSPGAVIQRMSPAPPQMQRSGDHLIKRSNPGSGPCTLLGQDSSSDPGGGSAGELDLECESRTGLAPCCLLATLDELDREVLESLPGR